jgi:thiol-disulfide isomerase/thioredoxin
MIALVLSLLIAGAALPRVGEADIVRVIGEHRGKVAVVNFWATWCSPCREEFPDLVRLYEENRDDLVVVSISMDEPDEAELAAAYLEEQKARFPAYLRGFDDFEVFANLVDPSWSGAIPATFIFDRQGNRVSGHQGKLSYEELTELVKQADEPR